jgi:hypothetical protein
VSRTWRDSMIRTAADDKNQYSHWHSVKSGLSTPFLGLL